MSIFRRCEAEIEYVHGHIKYVHGRKINCRCAYESNEKIKLKIFIPRYLGVCDVELVLYSDEGEFCRINGEFSGIEQEQDVFNIAFARLMPAGLYFFTLSFSSLYGKLYAKHADGKISFVCNPNLADKFQLSVSNFKYDAPDWIYGGVIYHIFVDRFARGDEIIEKPGAKIVNDWSLGVPEYPEFPGAELKNNTFYGGSLYGVINKLAYIKSLGVNAIYLSPVFDSPSNHKYDTSDYMSVDRMFGGEEALSRLIKEASSLGIGIIIDGVFNHTGADSIYFNKFGKYSSVGAFQSDKSPYIDWYDFKDYPNKYTCWWGIEILPRINPDIKSCRDYFVGEGGVIEKYAKMGISGIRLDVVDELSDDFVSAIKEKISGYGQHCILYGEVWEDGSNKIAYDTRKRYYLGEELDGVMNYPLRRGIISYLRDRETSALKYALTDIINNAPWRIANAQMNVLGTHDTERVLTALGGEDASGFDNAILSKKKMSASERSFAKKLLKMAYAILATVPGIPAIYYGDEAGVEGYSDPFNRLPYPWDNEDEELISFYRKIATIRTENTVYKLGDFNLLHIDSSCLVFSRTQGNVALITVVNNSEAYLNVGFESSAYPLFGDGEQVAPYSFEIFKTQTNNNIIL